MAKAKLRDRSFIERGTERDKEALASDRADSFVKNPWRWEWLDYVCQPNDQKLSDCIRLIKKPGFAVCVICDKEIKYSSRGRMALTDHVSSYTHSKVLKLRKSNTLLPGRFHIKV